MTDSLITDTSAIAGLVLQYAPLEAAADDWKAVADRLNAKTLEKTSNGQLTGMGRTLQVLTAEEREPTLAAFNLSEMGRDGRTKLATDGLDFAHPLTVGLIRQMDAAGKLPPGVAAKLLALGRWQESPAQQIGHVEVMAEQCRTEYLTQRLRDRLINTISNAVGRILIDMSPDEQIKALVQSWTDAV